MQWWHELSAQLHQAGSQLLAQRETGEGRLIAPPTPVSDCMQPSVLLMHVWLFEGGTGTPPSRMAVGLCSLDRRSSVRGLGQLGSTHLSVAEP